MSVGGRRPPAPPRRIHHAPLATTRTAADNAADLARWAARWCAAEGKASRLRDSLRTITAELRYIDDAVDGEEDGAELWWAHRPAVWAEQQRLAGLVHDAEREAAEALDQIRSYGVEPEALR